MSEREDGFATESVWDYPRPPRLERVRAALRVEHAGVVIAQTQRGWRVLETSHPPVYYFPLVDVRLDLLRPSRQPGSFCEWKGVAQYWDLAVPGAAAVPRAGWSYPTPSRTFAEMREAIAFYASKVDACYVAEERVEAQAGDFYGGWVTSWIRGPFKGGPGTAGW